MNTYPRILLGAASVLVAGCTADDNDSDGAADAGPSSGLPDGDTATPDSGGPVTTGANTTSTDTSIADSADDGGSTSSADSDTGPVDCPFPPTRTLAAIPNNTALDLGRYDCEDRMPQIANGCDRIFDFSRFNYDPVSHRLVLFGGGHSASGRTDVDTFDLQTLTWQSLYPSMSCEEVEAGNLDPNGFHIRTGHPAARHTYDQNVVAKVNGEHHLLMFSWEGFPGFCHPDKVPMHAVAKLSLEADSRDSPPWTYSSEFLPRMPWGYAGTAEFDPVSGMVVMVARGAGWELFVYDPSTDDIVHRQPGAYAHHGNLHYDPIGDRMILLTRADDGNSLEQQEIILGRDDWTSTTIDVLATSGTPPVQARSSAYDSRNAIIGAFGEPGVFSALDLATNTWSTHRVDIQSDDPEIVFGDSNFWAMDYDPINNVFLYAARDPNAGAGTRRMWAYRYNGPATECEP